MNLKILLFEKWEKVRRTFIQMIDLDFRRHQIADYFCTILS